MHVTLRIGKEAGKVSPVLLRGVGDGSPAIRHDVVKPFDDIICRCTFEIQFEGLASEPRAVVRMIVRIGAHADPRENGKADAFASKGDVVMLHDVNAKAERVTIEGSELRYVICEHSDSLQFSNGGFDRGQCIISNFVSVMFFTSAASLCAATLRLDALDRPQTELFRGRCVLFHRIAHDDCHESQIS